MTIQSNLHHLGPVGRSWLMLGGLLLVLCISLAPLFPWKVTPAEAPRDVFSGERAIAHLSSIARQAHPSGSPTQAQVRDYLVQQLTELGLEVEVQRTWGVENVVARLQGTDPSGAILLQAHYDSYGGPGAADNGAGVSALLEVMRALAAGSTPSNDIIALFDDSEEIPDAFTGTKAFIHEHPWMADVGVAIGMDTAVRGFISTDDTGEDNGWLVQALARAYPGGAWTSVSGGGNYDTQPFRQAGIRVLELEDNYPFVEQHTENDVPAIVNPGSMQQLGEQALAVVRELGSLDLSDTSGEQETYMHVPLLGLAHYPQSWALPLAILAGVLVVIACGLCLWRRLATWRGLFAALLATVLAAGLAAVGVNALWQAAPDLFGWETYHWRDWPEVIPPNGWWILILSNLAVFILTVVLYRLARHWSTRADYSLLGLLAFLAPTVLLAITEPRAAIIVTWPVLIGALSWIATVVLHHRGKEWAVDAGAMVAAIPSGLYILPLIVSVFMGDGTKSVASSAGVFAVLLAIILPVVDDFLISVWMALPSKRI
jgi:hypothetical protein